jgi:transketolase
MFSCVVPASQRKSPLGVFALGSIDEGSGASQFTFGLKRITPFVAIDQIRMAQYAEGNVKIVGSHAGVSIGQDGSSQMGLEDLAMMRSVLDSVVLYPSDAVSTLKCVVELHNHEGVSYLRLTREKTPVIYNQKEEFPIGGSKVVYESSKDKAVVVSAGITLHEAIKACTQLKEKGTSIAVVDAYSVKPLDVKTITRLAKKTGHVIVVEDHYPYGGLGEAVQAALQGVDCKVTRLDVTKIPRSGTPAELLAFENIDAKAIVKAVK